MKTFITAMLAITLLAAPALAGDDAKDTAKELKRVEADIKRLETSIKNTKDRISRTEDRKYKLRRKGYSNATRGAYKRAMDQYDGDIEKDRARLAEYEAQLNEARLRKNVLVNQ